MAVMTSSAFDTAPLDLKAASLPPSGGMAMDSETNGMHRVEQNMAPEVPTMNGNHKLPDTAPAVEPATNVSSGIDGVAQFLPDSQPDNSSLFGEVDANAPGILDAVEAPTSDVRDEIALETSGTVQQSSDGTQKVPETQLASQSVDGLDAMDVSQDAPETTATTSASTAPPTKPMNDLRIETQERLSEAPLAQSPTTLDQEMEDAPASGKVRPREDDADDMGEDERNAKRTKTTSEADDQAEFKVPPVPNHADQPNGGASTTAAAPSQEHSFVQPAVSYKEWPTAPINEAQRRFLLERIRNTKKIKVSLAFKDPVDFVALNIPQYPDFVKNPMDLGTMEGKLKAGEYHQIVDFMKDLDQIVTNSELFNGKEHPVTQNGYNMRAYFLKGCDRLPREGEEPAKASKPVKKQSVSAAPKPRRESRTAPTAKSPTAPTPTAASPNNPWPLQSDGLPLIRRDSSSANDRPKREIHRPPSKDLPYSTAKPRKKKYQQELKFCESVVAEIMNKKYAKFSYPFLAPVDPVALNIPSYLKIIKNPKDFGTIEKDLKAGAYQSAKDFYKDANLVFQNCYKFNIEGDEVHKMGKQLHELFNSLWSEKAEWLAQHAPEAEPPSPGSGYSDEEDEEEDDETDPAQAQFLAIQQQIAQLNETAQQLLQQQKGKRTSPKAPSKKKSKSSSSAQPKRRNTQLSVPPPVKAGKPKARAKAPAPLSYAQKQEISDGISTLGDADMRRAVQIIRNGCPNLANTNDDEMELDMDEINDDTLRELFKFIKSVQGPKGAIADDDFEPPRTMQRQSTATRPKKHKPMGKSEQEEKMRLVEAKMRSFSGAVSGSSHSPPANNDESSDDDDESASESEEE